MSNSNKEYIGLTKKAAQDKAERQNLIFRLIRVDAEMYLSYPEDLREDRVCVEFDNGKATVAAMR
jgi:hypothetical protein